MRNWTELGVPVGTSIAMWRSSGETAKDVEWLELNLRKHGIAPGIPA